MNVMVDTPHPPVATGRYSLPEACALLGCARVTLNKYILDGRLPATRTRGGHWFLDEAGIAQARSMVRTRPRNVEVCSTCLRAGELLYTWGSGAVPEMTPIMGIVEGNVRKHLQHLAKDGHAMRQRDGDWVLTPKGRVWMGGWMKITAAEEPDEVLEASFRKGVDAPG